MGPKAHAACREKAAAAPRMRRKSDGRRSRSRDAGVPRIEPKDSVTAPKDNDSVPWINFELRGSGDNITLIGSHQGHGSGVGGSRVKLRLCNPTCLPSAPPTVRDMSVSCMSSQAPYQLPSAEDTPHPPPQPRRWSRAPQRRAPFFVRLAHCFRRAGRMRARSVQSDCALWFYACSRPQSPASPAGASGIAARARRTMRRAARRHQRGAISTVRRLPAAAGAARSVPDSRIGRIT